MFVGGGVALKLENSFTLSLSARDSESLKYLPKKQITGKKIINKSGGKNYLVKFLIPEECFMLFYSKEYDFFSSKKFNLKYFCLMYSI